MYAPNRATKYIQQNLIELKGEIDTRAQLETSTPPLNN